MLQANTPIQIERTSNGYVVYAWRQSDYAGEGVYHPQMVFQSFAALVDWLGSHFSYRTHYVHEDPTSAG